MSDPLDPLFRDLQPPAGGLAALHDRLERRARRRRRLVVGGTALAAAAALLLVVRPAPPLDLHDPSWEALQRGHEPGAEAIEGTVLQTVSTNPDVLFYRVAAAPRPGNSNPR